MNHTKLLSIVRAWASLAFVFGVVSPQVANATSGRSGGRSCSAAGSSTAGTAIAAPEVRLARRRPRRLPPRRGPAAGGDRSAARRQRLRAESYLPTGHVLTARSGVCLLAAGRSRRLSGLCTADRHGPALWRCELRYAYRRVAGPAGGAVAYADRVPQPLGHVVTPTGPNGYVYRPYYQENCCPSPRWDHPKRPSFRRRPRRFPFPKLWLQSRQFRNRRFHNRRFHSLWRPLRRPQLSRRRLYRPRSRGLPPPTGERSSGVLTGLALRGYRRWPKQ